MPSSGGKKNICAYGNATQKITATATATTTMTSTYEHMNV
jgi:hypothetical protein